ncbi:DUF6734 family protein [Flavobacterium taihuense]|uniref:DUF6734 domain-containing protein n=1 Tax=Flavobacterium taihuense TaxID=2857508 RepID=A0ABS6Y050_9FLAO|nr:DUF6734 family protein [Flavobacterium taihuense]MBW4362002.1 hypothetical protein [Flavobacterium taihuense]
MIIQSFWSKPFLSNSIDPNSRFKGGWLNEKYFYFSMALSCLKFKELYGEVNLYTDSKGEFIINKTLGIPYSNFINCFDNLETTNEKLWAFPKLYTYSAQKKPFIHADTDVYIWEKFPEELINSPLFCQNIEENFPIYSEALEEILTLFDWIPSELINSLYKHKKVLAFNAGIIGGTDLDFFKKLYSRSEKFINKNQHFFDKIDVGIFNMIYEQQLGYAIADKKDIKPKSLFNNIDSNFTPLVNFPLASFYTKYIHAIGFAKKSIYACEQIEALLMYEFPQEYEKVKFNGTTNFLWKDYYEISELRKRFLFSIFKYVRENTIDVVCNTKFQLNPTVKIFEDNNFSKIEYVSPQTLQKEQLNLEDWENILLYFQESISINELCLELLLDNDIAVKYTKESLTEKLLSFVFDKCLLHEILLPHF